MSNNKNEASKTALLLLEILHHIPKRGKITAPEIHQRLETAGHKTTLRTVQRHLKTLCKQFEIECEDDSIPHGYRWLPEAEAMNLTQLTPQESLLLYLAEQQLSDLLPSKVMKNLSGFFAQAKKNLYTHNPEYPQHKLEVQWIEKIRVVPVRQPLLPPDLKESVFETVTDALYSNRLLEIIYKKPDKSESNPIIMPLGLAQQGERLYLVCRYEGFDNERSLALHRIQSAKMLSYSFERPSDFSLEKYDSDGRFLFGEGKKIKLTFDIKKYNGEHLYETPLSMDQTITNHGEFLTINATVVDSDALTWWLNGFGDNLWGVRKQSIL